ncbi:DNA gyrase subunit A [Escherichia coli]|nr:DNA gyrase subunit A [Escherichia coli]
MSDLAREITPVNIEEELKSSYLDYAMSVIVGRALPDVRDGLKPVHRRVLYAMNVLGNDWNKAYKKSARVVGDVIGKYHPHGDSAVYDTIVRMAQPFSLRYMLVDGQGNFGSIDGDSAAAMRYTEIRLAKIAHELMADLEKETVDFVDNYDGTEKIPDVMPTKIPNLLVNGSSGIAVGMATNIPPHNLTEVINGCLAYIDDEDISIEGLMEHIPGPDFPTAAIINGRRGIEEAYRTGRGKVYIRARAEVEVDAKTGRETIIVHEIPYQVNKARLIEKIAELVKEKRVEGISALRDESDKDGMRIVIEVKRDAVGEVVLNNLYSQTQLQVSFGINMVALHHGQPKIMNLKDIIAAFVRHRREVVTRRTIFELRKARDRAHILEALAVALANIDPIIELIRHAPTPAEAKTALVANPWQLGNVAAMLERAGDDAARPEWLEPEFGVRDGLYYLTEQQAQAILDLRLQKLTGLEHEKLLDEYKELLDQIAELLRILGSADRLMEVIREELELVREQFGDKANTHDHILCFSSRGRVYSMKVYQLPEATRGARGRPIVNLLPLEQDERITAILPVTEFEEGVKVFMATANGTVKKTVLTEFNRLRTAGKVAIKLVDGDELIGVDLTSGEDEVMLFSAEGKVVRFKESSVRAMGCNTTGVRGIRLGEGDKVVSLIVPRGDGAILTATQNGYGKRTAVAEYPTKSRATKGVISIKVTERNGLVVGAVQVDDCDQIMMITDAGTLVRTRVSEISIVGRNTQGVILIRTAEDENVVGLQRVAEPVDEEDLDTIDGSAAEGDDEIAPEVDVDDEPEEE